MKNVTNALAAMPARRWLAALVGLLSVAALVALTAAGSSRAATPTQSHAATAACGTLPAGPLNDPDHLVSKLPEQIQKWYSGLPYEVLPSAYTHWKPKNGPPWTIGFIDGPTNNAYNIEVLTDMKAWAAKLEAMHLIKQLIVYVTPTFDAATQIQQYQSLVERHVNLIGIVPVDAPALAPAIKSAFNAGIATVTTSGVVVSPYAVNWASNSYSADGAALAAYMGSTLLHDTGNVLMVEGNPTQPTATATEDGARAALALCPGIHIVGPTLDGNYDPSTAKSVVLQFLSSYTGKIDGVFDGGIMSAGELGAFLQLGRPVPAITNDGAIASTIAYWLAHPSFKSVATGSGGHEDNRIFMDIIMRVLEGKGPKLDDIIGTKLLINKSNATTINGQPAMSLAALAKYDKSEIASGSQLGAEIPPFSLMTESQLNAYFTSPGVKGPAGL